MPAKGRGRIRGRKATRGKKAPVGTKKNKLSSALTSDEEQENDLQQNDEELELNQYDNVNQHEAASLVAIEEDISKLEAPTFTTIDRGPPEPLHNNAKLRWDYKVNLIGEKVVNPLLHCCEKCSLPILVYGRMIPCKHVFCLDCGKASENSCPRCHDKVSRVEQSALGTVFMCMHGGSRHGHNGCRRTYLSQRDLQAHINHRHLRTAAAAEGGSHYKTSPKYDQSNSASSKSPGSVPLSPRDPRCQTISQATLAMKQLMEKHHAQIATSSTSRATTTSTTASLAAGQPSSSQTYSTPIPVMSTRTNLITVPIQDSSANQAVVQPIGGTASEYIAYSSAPVSSMQQTAPVAVAAGHTPTYQLQVANPYVHPPPQHPAAPVSYPTIIPPATYTTPISSSQVLSFSQPPPSHPTHMPPPPMHNPPVPVPQIYSAPPPAVPRPSINLQPSRGPGVPLPRQPYQTAVPYEDVPVGSPPYQWQGNGPPPRGVAPPARTTSYRPHFYQ